MENKNKNIFNVLFNDNPVFVLLLGMCSTLAVSTTFEKSYIMGLSVMFVLLFSSIIISLVSKFVNDEIRIPAYIIIITTFVTIIEVLMSKYSQPLYEALGVYLPLITVNCIILGKALTHASKNPVISSIKEAIKAGLGYTFAISILGIVREILGNNTITIMDNISKLTGYRMIYNIFPENSIIPNGIFLTSAGAFITLGIIIGIINSIRNRGEER